MQTMSHLSLQPAVGARAMGGFEESLARASLRRVEAKEFVFAEGDPTTHVFRVETGAVALYKVLADGRRQIVGFAYPGEPRIRADTNAIAIALSLTTCVVALLLTSSGWSF